VGDAFRPVILALYAWSEKHVTRDARKLVLIDRDTGEELDPMLVDRASGRPIEALDVGFTAGEHAGAGMRRRYAR